MRIDWLAIGSAAIVACVALRSEGRTYAAAVSELASAPAPTPAAVESPDGSPPANAGSPEGEPERCAPIEPWLPNLPTIGQDPTVPPLVRPELLASFYEKLARVARGVATDHVRIAVYGDSNGVQDFLTGAMRRVLQGRYGDAGHGFLAMAKPWPWYKHMDVRHSLMLGVWDAFAASTHPTPDGFYGHGLIAAHTALTGAATWLETAKDDAPIGRTASRFDVAYLKGPEFGTFDVKLDGALRETLDASAAEHSAAFYDIRVDDAPHKLEFIARKRSTRILGVSIERPVSESVKPSVIIDGLGVGALNCPSMLRDDASVNRATLRRRNYDLVILHVGTNTTSPREIPPCFASVIDRHKDALPDTPFMIMSTSDFLIGHDPPQTPKWLLPVQRAERQVADDKGVAFFDFFAAMGGAGSMDKFEFKGMTVGDRVHFNQKGNAYMAPRVVYALWKGFDDYVAAHPDAGCR